MDEWGVEQRLTLCAIDPASLEIQISSKTKVYLNKNPFAG